MYGDAVYWFCGCSFFSLIECLSMIVWTTTVFECLICMRFLFLYLHLFSTIEYVSHGKALKKYAHYYYYYYKLSLSSVRVETKLCKPYTSFASHLHV